MTDVLCTFGLLSVVFAVIYRFRITADLRHYRDGIFQIVKVLDLPLEEWQKKYGKGLTEEQWFGYCRGYQRALRDALIFLSYDMQIHAHTNRLEPTPNEDESLSDYAPRK